MEEVEIEPAEGLRRPIVVGHLAITLPIWVSMLSAVSLISNTLVAGLVGLIPAYAWWAIVTPRWRYWTATLGVDQAELQKVAYRTGLIWPPGHFLERTELHLSDRAFYGLITFLALVSFLAAETLLSETLESRLGLPGMLGSLVAAGISGAIVIPVQASLRRFLKTVREKAPSFPPADGTI